MYEKKHRPVSNPKANTKAAECHNMLDKCPTHQFSATEAVITYLDAPLKLRPYNTVMPDEADKGYHRVLIVQGIYTFL